MENIDRTISEFNLQHSSMDAVLDRTVFDEFDKCLTNGMLYLFKYNDKNTQLFGGLTSYILDDDVVNQINCDYLQIGSNYLDYCGKYRSVHYNYNSDVILQLPNSYEEYYSQRGKSTKKKIKWYFNKINREKPDFELRVYQNNDIKMDIVKRIYGLHILRCEQKNIRRTINDDDYVKDLNKLVNNNGVIVSVFFDGEIQSGCVLFRNNDHVFNTMISHNPDFNEFDLGIITYIESIKWCIKNGIKKFHFLNEMTTTKKILGGELVEVYSIRIYKNICLKYVIDRMITEPFFYHFKKYVKTDEKARHIIDIMKKNKLIRRLASYILDK